MAQQLETVTKTTTAPDGSTTTEITKAATDESSPPKPGYKTTEFYFKLAAMVLSALFASGALTNNTALAIAGMAASVLTAMGYAVTRAMVKS